MDEAEQGLAFLHPHVRGQEPERDKRQSRQLSPAAVAQLLAYTHTGPLGDTDEAGGTEKGAAGDNGDEVKVLQERWRNKFNSNGFFFPPAC